jgi:acyl-CoA reductase-like NAD-dependent aldehyde dehydrogenase
VGESPPLPWRVLTDTKVHEASEEDTDNAVAAAKEAFPAWSALSPEQRAKNFKKLATLIRENNDELAALEAASMGKPLGAFFDAHAAASKFEHYAEAGYSVQGTTSVQTPGYLNMTLRQPYGVVAAIIPWNVPLLFLANKVAPALIVGNTVVLKSSEKAPLTVRATVCHSSPCETQYCRSSRCSITTDIL